MESELEEYQRQLEAIKQEARSLIEGLTDEQFNWHPAPGVWSIADNLAHLNVTGQLYLSRIDASIEEARSKELFGAGPFRHSFLGNWFLRLLEPPVKRKFKAPKIFVPMPDQPLARVAPEFISLQDEVLERLHRANGLNLARARVASPISRFLRLSLGQSFLLITSHERRHLWQAAQVKAAQGFPV
ncbi:MAG TPA: DinB family protein [Pyrinomonadaceae bacterium]